MQKKDIMEYAGNLHEEMEEIKKVISEDDSMVPYGTSTRGCAAFLTIYCC